MKILTGAFDREAPAAASRRGLIGTRDPQDKSEGTARKRRRAPTGT